MLFDNFKRNYRFKGNGNSNLWLAIIISAIAFALIWFLL